MSSLHGPGGCRLESRRTGLRHARGQFRRLHYGRDLEILSGFLVSGAEGSPPSGRETSTLAVW